MKKEIQDIKFIKNIAKKLYSDGDNYRNSVLGFPNKYSSVWEGVEGTSNGEIFCVSVSDMDFSVSNYNIQRPDNTVSFICTDCNRLYLVDNIENTILTYTIESLTDSPPVTDWEWSTSGVPTCVCCDGNRVFIGYFNDVAGHPMVESYLSTGEGASLLQYDDAGTDPVVDLSSNGQYLAFVRAGVVTKGVWLLDATDLTYYDHTAIAGIDINSSIYISYDRYFVTVNDGMALDRLLVSYGFDGSLLETLGWIPVLADPQSRMCSDGESLFVHVDGILYRYEYRYTSPTGYTWINTVSCASCGSICVDDRYVYLWDSINDITVVVDKFTGKTKWVTAHYISGPLCSDGINTYSIQISFPAGENYINIIPSRSMSKLFRNVSGSGIRRKYFTLANPV